MGDGKYRVYAIKLHHDAIPWSLRWRYQRAAYVGSSIKPRRVRFHEHITGHFASGVVYRHGLRLAVSLTRHLQPFWTRPGAERAERRLARELRTQGWYVVQG
jgi:hypothetical protein